jgi:tryptophan synthase alpha subunit
MSIELKPIQMRAARLLASGTTVSQTAEIIGTVRQTVHAWKKYDDGFIAYLNILKNEQLESTRTQIQAASNIAVNTLVDVMQKSKNDNAKIAAAKEILSMSGFTKESMQMFAWGVGGETVEKVRADKKSEKIMESLTLF